MELNVDGSSLGNPGRGGIGVVCDKTPMVMYNIGDNVTNVQAEWIAVIEALKLLSQIAPKDDNTIYSDSELVVKQLHGEYKVKSNKMLYTEALQHINVLENTKIRHVPRTQNHCADGIAKKAAKNSKANYRYFTVKQNTTDNISITKDGKVLNFSIDEAKDLKNRLEDFLNGMDTN